MAKRYQWVLKMCWTGVHYRPQRYKHAHAVSELKIRGFGRAVGIRCSLLRKVHSKHTPRILKKFNEGRLDIDGLMESPLEVFEKT